MTALFGNLRETFFGMCLLMTHISAKKSKNPTPEKLDYLWIMYWSDLLGIKNQKAAELLNVLKEQCKNFQPFLKVWIELDDNKEFLDLITKNIESFFRKKNEAQLLKAFSGDDIIWFRGLLKNITYYNKRYLFPCSE